MKKELGKIESVRFGIGGYQDSMLGIHVSLGFPGAGCADSRCAWDANLISRSEICKWSEEDRSKQYDEIMRYVSDLLHKSKVDSVHKLKGIPIEATFEGNTLKEWRILEEVI